MQGINAPTDANGNKTWFQNGYWFAYAGKFASSSYGVCRGKGLTKEEAIADSIKSTEAA